MTDGRAGGTGIGIAVPKVFDGYATLWDSNEAADRLWFVSALWDDEWTCVGGSAALPFDCASTT